MLVEIGQHYIANVAGRRTVVKVTGRTEATRWSAARWVAVNVRTKREVQMKTTRRFLTHVPDSIVGQLTEVYS